MDIMYSAVGGIYCWSLRQVGRKNCAIEAFILLAQYHFLLSSWQSNQLMWSNVHGLPGRNIPAKLFMEHLNRVCKEAMKRLGPNKTEKGV